VVAAARRLRRRGERRAHHDSVRASHETLADIAARTDPAIGNDRDIPAALLVVVVARRSAVDRRCDLRDTNTEHLAACAGRARPDANEHSGHARTHDLERRRKPDRVPHDQGMVILLKSLSKRKPSTLFDSCRAVVTVLWMTRMSAPASCTIGAIRLVFMGVVETAATAPPSLIP
jgi:hypothetical protein